jgi:hypothetical protein
MNLPIGVDAFIQTRSLEFGKASMAQVLALVDIYRASSTAQQTEIEAVLATMLLSYEEADRYDACVVVRECLITGLLPKVRELEGRLAESDDVSAPFEWAKVNRLIGQLVAALG